MTSLVLSHVSNGMLNFAPTYLYVPSITSVLPFVPSELVELFSSSFVFAVSNTPIIPNMPITIIKNPKHIPITFHLPNPSYHKVKAVHPTHLLRNELPT